MVRHPPRSRPRTRLSVPAIMVNHWGVGVTARCVRAVIAAIPRTEKGEVEMGVEVVEGDLLAQRVDAIVNAWNRNVVPRWLLVPQGVPKAIKKSAGPDPFRELACMGSIPLGSAVLTTAGRLPYRGIIHVAGINLRWQATEASIRASTRNAVTLARQQGYQSIAFPIIGAGSGGFPEDRALDIMRASADAAPLAVRLVRYQPRKEAEK